MGTTEYTESTEGRECGAVGVEEPQLVYEALTAKIRQTAFEVHKYFGKGFLEKVYENSLAHRLEKQGHTVGRQIALSVRDVDGTVVGQYVADLVVDGAILVEIKAVSALNTEHHAQILNYLKATGLHVGMLLNFGHSRLQVKRFAL